MARWLIRVTVTLLVIGFWVAYFVQGNGHTWGFGVTPVAGQPYSFAVHAPRLFPVPLAAGLQEGDVIDLRSIAPAQRIHLLMETVPAGSVLNLQVQRAGKVRFVTLHATPWPTFDTTDMVTRALLIIHTLLGLLLLWRGRDWVAWWLAMYSLAFGMKDVVGITLVVAPVSAEISMVAMVILRAMRDFGLFAAALVLVRPMLSPAWARHSLPLMGLVVAGYFAAMMCNLIGLAHWGRFSTTAFLAGEWGMVLGAVISALIVAVGYRRSGESGRLRVRWFLVGAVTHAFSFMMPPMLWPASVLALLSIACFAYVALRHRLVDLSFAVSRTLVFATLAALVVGIFAIAEHAIASFAMGKQAGLVVHLFVPLALGIALHRVRERVEKVIERLLFRRQFDAERALLRLARECAYMEREDRLLARTVHDIRRHVRPDRVAIYRSCGGGYERLQQDGEPAWPRRIDADDAAFVALRAGAEDQALSAPDSVLGPGGIAFPMSMAGRLDGVIAIGDRAQQYTRSERELLRRVAREVGTALYGLKARHSEQLLEALAHGTLTVRDVREQVLRTGS